MGAALMSYLVDESRGVVAKRRRVALGVSRERVAHEAGVSVKTVKSYEEDARPNMPSGPKIEEALDRLEAAEGSPQRRRRATDTPERRAIDQIIETGEGEQVVVRFLRDGTRAIFVVPPSGRIPTEEELERLFRSVRGE